MYKNVLYTIRLIISIMKLHHYGSIINIAFITDKRGDNNNVPVYGGSKGAGISLTMSMVRELGPFRVTINPIVTYVIVTKIMSYWTEEKKRHEAEKILVERLGNVKDISYLVLFWHLITLLILQEKQLM